MGLNKNEVEVGDEIELYEPETRTLIDALVTDKGIYGFTVEYFLDSDKCETTFAYGVDVDSTMSVGLYEGCV